MTATIRRAVSSDAPALSHIATQTFTEAFGHLYPAEDLDAFVQATYAGEHQLGLLSDPGCALWLLEVDGRAVGYALAGSCKLPHQDVAAADGELKRLYVLREMQNCGWGERLLQTALDWLQRDGPRTLWIGVWSGNPGAQRFYARHGFERVGEYVFIVGRVRDDEYIFRRHAVAA